MFMMRMMVVEIWNRWMFFLVEATVHYRSFACLFVCVGVHLCIPVLLISIFLINKHHPKQQTKKKCSDSLKVLYIYFLFFLLIFHFSPKFFLFWFCKKKERKIMIIIIFISELNDDVFFAFHHISSFFVCLFVFLLGSVPWNPFNNNNNNNKHLWLREWNLSKKKKNLLLLHHFHTIKHHQNIFSFCFFWRLNHIILFVCLFCFVFLW